MNNGQFRDAKDHIDELERVKRREERKLASPVGSWKTEAADHHRSLRVVERERLLPKDRKCPRCGSVKIASRQWVVLVEGVRDKRWRVKLHAWIRSKARELETAAKQDRKPLEVKNPFTLICRSCYMIEPSDEPVEPFIVSELWWKLDHKAVKIARYNLCLTGAEVAEACGWSQSRQSKVETRSTSLMNDDDISKLQLALGMRKRPVDGEPVKKYILHGRKLMIARRAVGVSRKALGDAMDVSASRIAALERKKITRIESRVAASLSSTLFGISSAAEQTDT